MTEAILKYVPGWMGGNFTLDGKNIDAETLSKIKYLKISRKKYPVEFRERYGYDDDHGHRYDWISLDIGVIQPTIFSKKGVFVSIMDFPNHKVTAFLTD